MIRSCIVAIVLAMPSTQGCASNKESNTAGVSMSERAILSVPSTNWPENSFRGGRWTDDGDNDGASCWCNAQGDWGITSTISNHSIWCHNYRMGIEFGHTDNNAPNTFVAYSSQTTENINLCGHHDQKTARGSGAKIDAIRDNYNRINAARLTMYEFEPTPRGVR